ncbi:putative trypsin-like serine protease precursor [Conidiobolus coronatus NRRL 28638]|uniref:Putative trypsin-like serine protease n=1 Tax=Conidiobolus coronatus (strain ATCC 28846 / CBS 209.66 / NRRL 28638) TaxID=796925 RepID=A0A137P0L3_CONC2|nr:putative trypsin-like serine protease precursor [Conidiobolus coronatus NRRL 28638]|eukprot:KXN68404.1 putative trypsin-like serine protease precursor [Conidiobolus coronatus NRRL 28638]
MIGGNEVNPAFKYPFMMSIMFDDFLYCGGTLYNANTVITAAHCSFETASNYTVQSHRHNRTKTAAEEGGKVYNVKKMIIHPEYNGDTFRNDIAIWKLDTAADNSETFVDLDSGSLGNQVGLINTVMGWGALDYNIRTRSDTLQEAQLPITDLEKCKKAYESEKTTVNTTMMLCAGKDEGKPNPCYGDSGGPLGVLNNDRFTLVGIVSFGEKCGEPGYPEVFTRVSNYISWIKSYAN